MFTLFDKIQDTSKYIKCIQIVTDMASIFPLVNFSCFSVTGITFSPEWPVFYHFYCVREAKKKRQSCNKSFSKFFLLRSAKNMLFLLILCQRQKKRQTRFLKLTQVHLCSSEGKRRFVTFKSIKSTRDRVAKVVTIHNDLLTQ